jgi:hypothetical protein
MNYLLLYQEMNILLESYNLTPVILKLRPCFSGLEDRISGKGGVSKNINQGWG